MLVRLFGEGDGVPNWVEPASWAWRSSQGLTTMYSLEDAQECIL